MCELPGLEASVDLNSESVSSPAGLEFGCANCPGLRHVQIQIIKVSQARPGLRHVLSMNVPIARA